MSHKNLFSTPSPLHLFTARCPGWSLFNGFLKKKIGWHSVPRQQPRTLSWRRSFAIYGAALKSCQSWSGSGDPIHLMTVSRILFFDFGLLPWKASCQQTGGAAEAKRTGSLPGGHSGKFRSDGRIKEEWKKTKFFVPSWHLLSSLIHPGLFCFTLGFTRCPAP